MASKYANKKADEFIKDYPGLRQWLGVLRVAIDTAFEDGKAAQRDAKPRCPECGHAAGGHKRLCPLDN